MHFSLQSLGKVIAAERHARGYTQIQFAKMARLHRAYLSDVEQGHRNLTLDVLARIAETLSLRVSDLIVGAEKVQATAVVPEETTIVTPTSTGMPSPS